MNSANVKSVLIKIKDIVVWGISSLAIIGLAISLFSTNYSKLSDTELEAKIEKPKASEEITRRILLSLSADKFSYYDDFIKRFPSVATPEKLKITNSIEGTTALLKLAQGAIQNECLNDSNAFEHFSRFTLFMQSDRPWEIDKNTRDYFQLFQKVKCPLTQYSWGLANYFEYGLKAKEIDPKLAKPWLDALFANNQFTETADPAINFIKEQFSFVKKMTVSRGKNRTLEYSIDMDMNEGLVIEDGMIMAAVATLNMAGHAPFNLYPDVEKMRTTVYLSGPGLHFKMASLQIDRKSIEKMYGTEHGPSGLEGLDQSNWNAAWKGTNGISWLGWCKKNGAKCTYGPLGN